jgi:hypothetical protein
MSLQIASPFQQFFDRDGSPLDNGFVYVGTVNLNPETNPLTIYYDDALTIPAAQPLRTSNGYIVRNGSPARLYTSQEDFSLTVRDKSGVLVFTVADATSIANLQAQLSLSSGSSLIGYNQGGVGAVTRTVQSRLRDYVSVKDFGAVGDGVTDDTSAILAAVLAGCKFAPDGDYLVTSFSFIDDIENWQGDGNFVYNGATLPIGPVTSFLRLDVPSVFPTIQSAIDFAEAKTFRDAGFIQIKLADGDYGSLISPLNQIEPQFPSGSDRIEIIGNPANKTAVRIFATAANNAAAFLFQRGNGIFKIDGMTIIGVGGRTAYGVWNNQTYGAGIMVNYNSQALIGSQVEVSDFYYGIASRYGSGVRCEPGVVVRNAGDCGFFAYAGAMDCQDCQAYDVAHISDGLGFGFTAEAGGFMDCSNSNTSGNYRAGFYANGAGMWAKETTSDSNQGDGYLAINGGKIECNPPPGGAATNSFSNGGCGYNVSTNSYINANSCLCDGNGSDGYRAQNNSVIDVTIASSSNNAGNGFLAVDGSGMVGDGADAFQNTGDGFRADTLSWFRGSSYSANLNGGWGYFAQNLSYMNIPGSGGAGNVAGFDSPALAGTPANNGAYIEN